MLTAVALAAPVPKGAPPDPLSRGYMGVRASGDGSLVISSVEPDTPALRAGLKIGDRFLKVGPVKPETFEQVRELVMGLRPGTRVSLTVKRGDEDIDLVIELAVKPDLDQMELILP